MVINLSSPKRIKYVHAISRLKTLIYIDEDMIRIYTTPDLNVYKAHTISSMKRKLKALKHLQALKSKEDVAWTKLCSRYKIKGRM
jgi:hypothetical protein